LLEALRKITADIRRVSVPARTRATEPPVRVYTIFARSLPECTASHPAIRDCHTHHCDKLRCHTNKSQLRFCLYKLIFLPNQLCLCLTCTFPYEVCRPLISVCCVYVQATGNKRYGFFLRGFPWTVCICGTSGCSIAMCLKILVSWDAMPCDCFGRIVVSYLQSQASHTATR
jgi:hypothetical protein